MKSKKISAFTLAEVVIVVGIIGIIAEMTIPTLVQDMQERQIVTGLMKFNSTLQSAITMWKTEVGCNSDFGTCLSFEGYADNDPNAFLETIGKYFKITDKAIGYTNSKNWLPPETLDYYGDEYTGPYGSVAKTGSGNGAFLLQDGITFSIDYTSTNPALIIFYVDANGKKKPNRVGKDVFQILAGGVYSKSDVRYGAYHPFSSNVNVKGLCVHQLPLCETDNVNPTVGNGANPTMYVIMHQKLPDFKYLSTVVSGFRP